MDLVALRAFPVHPLGLVEHASWADGRLCSPAEYFFHDLDHARFKIREDLAVEGIALPDAYENGSTWDAAKQRHRLILPAAAGKIGSQLWERVRERRDLAARLLDASAALPDPQVGAARLLLFEIIYEKSHPLDRTTLARELASEAHMNKIARKLESGFYGADLPDAETMDALEAARAHLQAAL